VLGAGVSARCRLHHHDQIELDAVQPQALSQPLVELDLPARGSVALEERCVQLDITKERKRNEVCGEITPERPLDVDPPTF
jgi:hypothetical protein